MEQIKLKIKSKHLSEEAHIIKHEEHKLKKQVAWARNNYKSVGNNEVYPTEKDDNHKTLMSLKLHRTWDVRIENRATFLARAYIANKPYGSVESKREPSKEHTFQIFVLPRVVNMVAKYGCEKVPLTIWETGKGNVPNPALKQVRESIDTWIAL